MRHLEKAKQLLQSSIVIDAHSDYAIQLLREKKIGKKNILKNLHLPNLQKSNVNIEVMTVGGDFQLADFDCTSTSNTLKVIDAMLEEINENPKLFHLVENKKDLALIQKTNKTGFILGLEGGRPIGDDIANFRNFYRLGIRSIILTHNERNLMADGCSEPNNGGLSKFGKTFIKEISNLNVILDLVHLSEKGFYEVLDQYQKPIVVSHSNVKKLVNHYRNLTDDQIKAVGQSNGVIGINFLGGLIDEDPKNASIDRLIDHISYIADFIGIDHIGLGPDFADYYEEEIKIWALNNGFPLEFIKYCENCESIAKLENLVEKLIERNFTDSEISKILGDNFFRVYSQIL